MYNEVVARLLLVFARADFKLYNELLQPVNGYFRLTGGVWILRLLKRLC
jgi:hypothetical protein